MPTHPSVIDALTRSVWVLGDPIGHSRSPQLHNRLYPLLDLNWTYLACRCTASELESKLQALERIGAVGANLTMPLKSTVLPMLQHCSLAAQAIGAVNTVRFTPDGWEGDNTDWMGWIDSWNREIGESLNGRQALVLGAGGAARAIAWALLECGAISVKVMRRTWDHPADWLPGRHVEPLGWSAQILADALVPGCVVVNSTPIGMSNRDLPLAWPERLPDDCVACDLIYNPRKTAWLLEAERRGAKTLGGFGMLTHQAGRAVAWWSGRPVPPELLEQAADF
jgi:shikimate dehydrogenase